MALHPLVLFLHLLGAIVLLASSLHGPLLRAAIRRADDLAALRGWLRYAHDAARANPLAAFVVLASGVWLARGRWSEAWLVVSTMAFVAGSILSLTLAEGTVRRIAKLAATVPDGRIVEPLENLRASAAWEVGTDALLANDVTLLFLMVQQPGLVGSVASVLLANAAALGYWRLRQRRNAGSAGATLAATAGHRQVG